MYIHERVLRGKIDISGPTYSYVGMEYIDHDNAVITKIEMSSPDCLVLVLKGKDGNIGRVRVKALNEEGKGVLSRLVSGTRAVGKIITELRNSRLDDF